MNTSELISYLHELEANNNKTWFDANRPRYEVLRSEYTTLIQNVIMALGEVDPMIAKLNAADSLFRINRDIRFSADKTPYKTRFSAKLSPLGKEMGIPGYYTQINAEGELVCGAGVFALTPKQLSSLRTYIANHVGEFTSLLNDLQPTFGDLKGEALKNVPREYPANHPAGEYLKHKGFVLHSTETIKDVPQKDLVKYISEQLSALYPFVEFLRAGIE